jgi:hypothetical protein
MSREQQRASRESKKNAVRNDISRRIFCFAPVAISWLLPFQSRRNSRRESHRRRCIIPADGFYEWRNEGKRKVPMWVHLKNK